MNLQTLGPEGSWHVFKVPRHEVTFRETWRDESSSKASVQPCASTTQNGDGLLAIQLHSRSTTWTQVNGDRMLTANECLTAMCLPKDTLQPANHKLTVPIADHAVAPVAGQKIIAELLAAD